MLIVKDFASMNFLQVNIQKCEIMVFSNSNSSSELPCCEIEGSVLPVRTFAKCLRYWWNKDLIASKSVEENIKGPTNLSSIMEALAPFMVISIPCPLSPSLRLVCQSCNMAAKIVTKRCLKRLDSF